MIKNEQAPDCCKNRLPPDTCFYSNIDPLDLHCCNNRSLGATCFYSNPEPTKNVNKLRTERARRIHNAVKTGLLNFHVSRVDVVFTKCLFVFVKVISSRYVN